MPRGDLWADNCREWEYQFFPIVGVWVIIWILFRTFCPDKMKLRDLVWEWFQNQVKIKWTYIIGLQVCPRYPHSAGLLTIILIFSKLNENPRGYGKLILIWWFDYFKKEFSWTKFYLLEIFLSAGRFKISYGPSGHTFKTNKNSKSDGK